jgi:outer membrane protein assembly factor BamB
MFRHLFKLCSMFSILLLAASFLTACQPSTPTQQGPLAQCTPQDAPVIKTLAASHSSPQVFYLSDHAYLYELNAGDGALGWCEHYQDESPHPNYFTGLTHINDKLYIGASDNNLFSLNPTNGSLLHSYLHLGDNSDLGSPMIFANGTIYEGTIYGNSNTLEAISLQTGKVSWQYSLVGAQMMSNSALANGLLYFDFSENSAAPFQSHLVALDARTGTKRWDDVWNDPLIQGNATIVQGIVLVTLSPQILAPEQVGTLQAVDAQTGKLLWNNNSDYLCSPSAGSDLFYGVEGNSLDAFNIQTGSVLWSVPQVQPLECLVNHGVLYAFSHISGKNTIFAFNSQTGKKLWQASLRNIPDGSPQIVFFDPLVLVGDELFLWTMPSRQPHSQVTLHAFNVKAKKEDWYANLPFATGTITA